jgi:hypothetical protein
LKGRIWHLPALPSPQSNLLIAGTPIKQDSEGRYCLNDLHTAAGGDPNHQPAKWLRNQQTQELIAEVSNSPDLESLPVASTAGRNGGTYVSKPLVYAYAMWISPKFHLQVIETFDALVTGKLQVAKDL